MNKAAYLSELSKINGVVLEAVPLYDNVPNLVKVEMPFLVTIKVGDHTALFSNRKSVHIAFILDVSGSMKGEPLKQSIFAITQIISKLTPNDRVSFITYNETVKVIFNKVSEVNLELINTVKADGLTNISGAISETVKMFDTDPNYTNIALLFSDGDATVGIKNIEEMGELILSCKNFKLSTFGLGDSYNEQMLSIIARQGHGHHFYINTPDKITNAVEKGVIGFMSNIGENVTLQCTGADNCAVIDLDGDNNMLTLVNGKKLASLRNLGLYQFIVNVMIKNTDLNPEIAALNVKLTFANQLTHAEEVIETSGKLHFNSSDKITNYDVLVKLTLDQCELINNQVNMRNLKLAIDQKTEIITKLKEVLEIDKYGIVAAMLEKEEALFKELTTSGATPAAAKSQNKLSSTPAAAWEPSVESDGDMGFSLFD